MEWLLFLGFLFVSYIVIKEALTGSKKRVSYTDSSGEKKSEGLKRRRPRQILDIEKPDIEITPEIAKVLDKFENTSENIFLTGKAGTGKSTLLTYFRATTEKNCAVVAPTGVAAVNVQGQTIHSFFGFGIDITPERVKYVKSDRLNLFRNLDTLIIDEISMVRADLLDCVDASLRKNRRNNLPFGGVQIIAIGDPFQLPPVVTSSESEYMEKVYSNNPYFFNAHSYKRGNFSTFELTKVYRQHDEEFIGILNAVRVGEFTEGHIDLLNKKAKEEPVEDAVRLVTTNALARSINNSELRKLPGEEKKYIGRLIGDFKEKSVPTDIELYLKEGARVMLLNNDKRGRWINGDVGTIIGLGENSVRVKFDDNTFDDVDLHQWDNIRFVYDDEEGRVVPEIVGKFVQLPIKLAWAVTIHKAQGKTYDHVHIDFGTGTFAPGQAYVALSRCTGLQGLSFEAPMVLGDVITDQIVKSFMEGDFTVNQRGVESYTSKEGSDLSPKNKKVTKSDINKLMSFINSPDKYAIDTPKARGKVEASQKTYSLIKDVLDKDTKHAYQKALKRYESKMKNRS